MIICALYTELCMKNGLWSMVVVTHCRRIYMHCMHAREWGLYNGFVPTYFHCHRALFAVLCQPHIPRLLWCCCRKYPVRSTTASKANRGIPLCLFLLTYTLQSTWWRWKKKKLHEYANLLGGECCRAPLPQAKGMVETALAVGRGNMFTIFIIFLLPLILFHKFEMFAVQSNPIRLMILSASVRDDTTLWNSDWYI